VIAYIMQMLAFLILRSKFSHLDRPYVSPMGRFGAWLALLIAAFTLFYLFRNPDFRLGVVGVAVWFVLGLAYFAFYGRKTMVFSPEEEFAINIAKTGQSGDTRKSPSAE
jgi:ethanolamine permease